MGISISDLDIDVRLITGNNAKTYCPQCRDDRKHNKRDKPLSIHTGTGVYKCHHCGASGILEEYKMVGKAAREFKDNSKDTYTPPPTTSTVDIPISSKAFEYLNSRAISLDTAKRAGVRSHKKRGDVLAFNYYEEGKLVNIKYRSIKEKKFHQEPGGKQVFFGVDDIQGGGEVIICEGEMDKLSFDEAGFTNSVSVPGGAPNPNDTSVDGKLKCLQFAEDILNSATKVYLATDDDPPGKRLQDELGRRIGREKCFRVVYPQGCKDANDVLMEHGVEGVKSLLKNAEGYPIEGLVTVADVVDEVYDLYENGITGYSEAGFKEFDKLMKFLPGYLVTITGQPTHGKSNFAEQLIIKLAVRHGWKWAIFTPEHTAPLFLQRLLRIYTGKHFFGKDKMSRQDVENGLKFLNTHIFMIYPRDEEYTVDNVLGITRQIIYRFGVKGLLVDTWTDLVQGSHERETEVIKKELGKIKSFNKRHDVMTMVVAHTTKLNKKEDGTYPIPTLYDISGSAHWYNRSEFGMSIYRLEEEVQVHIQKVKFEGILGDKGVARFRFDTMSNRYYEFGEPDNPGYEQAVITQGKMDMSDPEEPPF